MLLVIAVIINKQFIAMLHKKKRCRGTSYSHEISVLLSTLVFFPSFYGPLLPELLYMI